MHKDLKLINMSDIPCEEVGWLWYPYIPYGKLTIVHGDPGEGKTTFVLALAALLTTGRPLPGSDEPRPPVSIIYQTAEDGLGDTIKPRLEQNGADCSKVLVIDDSQSELTLDDERLLEAIRQTGAKLLVFDPIQAYLGGGTDMHRANEVRPVLQRLGQMAQQTGCAVILIGHMNKMQGAKQNYRLLGSMDFIAATRSVLVIGRDKNDFSIRIVAHGKSNLAPEGRSIRFALDKETGFSWQGFCDITADELTSASGTATTKTSQAENLLREILQAGQVPSRQVEQLMLENGISEKTMKNAKKNIGVIGEKIGNQWFCVLSENLAEGGKEVSS